MAFYKGNPDIIIRNGTVIDGTGQTGFFADVAIKGDRIDYIGDLKDVTAPLEIDATGKYVTPGFIDSHTHSDMQLFSNPLCQSAVRQGVTTEVVGNCGFSMRNALVSGAPFDPAGDGIKCVYEYNSPEAPKGSMAAVLDKAEKMGTSMNTAWLCGHNDLRVLADLRTTEYTEEQFRIMADFLKEAMDAGFIGFSTGLEFDPGIMSKPEEVERLAAIAAKYDAIYTTHMRDESYHLLDSIEEFLNVIRKTGMRGMVSHLNVKYDNGVPGEYLYKGMDMLKAARKDEHLNVYCDMLPTTFATGAALAMLPPWLYADGWDAAKATLADPEGREKVKNDLNRYWYFLGAGQWDRLLFLLPLYWPEVAQTPFKELCEKWGKAPVDCYLDVMAAAKDLAAARTVTMQGVMFDEQTMIDSVIRDPIYLWQTDTRVSTDGSDGPLVTRNNIQDYMSMFYFFVRYVRELGAITLEEAVCKATSRVASHFRLRDRGMLMPGFFADVNVFALEDLTIHATFSNPRQYCTGMDYVIVNGTPVIAKGEHTKARPGRVLRHQ
jgi:N-acyl-D-amino-acid deacylase